MAFRLSLALWPLLYGPRRSRARLEDIASSILRSGVLDIRFASSKTTLPADALYNAILACSKKLGVEPWGVLAAAAAGDMRAGSCLVDEMQAAGGDPLELIEWMENPRSADVPGVDANNDRLAKVIESFEPLREAIHEALEALAAYAAAVELARRKRRDGIECRIDAALLDKVAAGLAQAIRAAAKAYTMTTRYGERTPQAA
jgi:hypothetical protein